MSENIVFAGHFAIGEKINRIQLLTIQEAKRIGGQLAVLINDLDFARKLKFYEIGGKDMVIKHYGQRVKCGTYQPICRLPEFKEVAKIIDWKVYDWSLKIIKNLKTLVSVKEALRDCIVPELISKRLEGYGLKKSNVEIYTERQLRNIASHRLSRKNKSMLNWISQLEKTGLLNDVETNPSGIPVCGGILLALYEKVSMEGYKKIVQIYSKDDINAIEKGIKICKTLAKNFPKDPRWQLKFENIYF